MPKALAHATRDQVTCLENAIKSLKDARMWARSAGTPKTLAAINHALSSADGAKRHLARRLTHSPDF